MCVCSGLIPAHAGKTSSSAKRMRSRRAHPRSRGENCARSSRGHRGSGSSPLTRGKPMGYQDKVTAAGLIPAHAGKTVLDNAEYFTAWAHPRSRGENSQSSSEIRRRVGSSPLTRGKRDVPRGEVQSLGLIPAHAGKTRARARGLGCWWAHPRSRGENGLAATSCSRVLGSSPLTRGKLTTNPVNTHVRGLIPAHARKT